MLDILFRALLVRLPGHFDCRCSIYTMMEVDENKPVISGRKKMFRMNSCDKDVLCNTKFEFCPEEPLPIIPPGGARIKVCFAGACSQDTLKSRNIVRNSGIMDTSLFPGYEMSGVVDEICQSAWNTKLKVGERVIIYPEEDVGFDKGYSEYVVIKNLDNIIPVPRNMSLEVAAMLPCGGLTAYTAVMRAKPYIKSTEQQKGKCNILVIGAGGLGLWTITLASQLKLIEGSEGSNLRVVVADTSSENLLLAQDHGCYGVIHWPADAYEEAIMERTKSACRGGVDVVIDFVSSPRTISRAIRCLNKGGALVVGGNSQYDVPIDLATLARNEQCILGVRRGCRDDLMKLMELVDSGLVHAPQYSTFPVRDATKVFQDLSECKIKGRAVLQVSYTTI